MSDKDDPQKRVRDPNRGSGQRFDPLSLVQVLIMLMQYLLWLMIKIGEIDTSNLQQTLVASFQPPPWPQKHVHENRGIEDLAT